MSRETSSQSLVGQPAQLPDRQQSQPQPQFPDQLYEHQHMAAAIHAAERNSVLATANQSPFRIQPSEGIQDQTYANYPHPSLSIGQVESLRITSHPQGYHPSAGMTNWGLDTTAARQDSIQASPETISPASYVEEYGMQNSSGARFADANPFTYAEAPAFTETSPVGFDQIPDQTPIHRHSSSTAISQAEVMALHASYEVQQGLPQFDGLSVPQDEHLLMQANYVQPEVVANQWNLPMHYQEPIGVYEMHQTYGLHSGLVRLFGNEIKDEFADSDGYGGSLPGSTMNEILSDRPRNELLSQRR